MHFRSPSVANVCVRRTQVEQKTTEQLEQENKALQEAHDMLESCCVTLATAYMVQRLKQVEQRIDKAAATFLDFERRLQELESSCNRR